MISKRIYDFCKQHAPHCDLIFLNGPRNGIPYSTYLFDRQEAIVIKTPGASQAYYDRLALHEICHHITWNPEWHHEHSTVNKAEYAAERLTRIFCEIYGWHDILEECDRMMLGTNALMPVGVDLDMHDRVVDIYGWPEAAERIIREEGLYR